MPYSLARRAAAGTVECGETVTGSAVIHCRTRPSLGWTRIALARMRSPVVRIPMSGRSRAALEEALGHFTQRVLGRNHEKVLRHELVDAAVLLVEGQPAGLQPFERLVIELHFEGNRFGGGNAEGRGGSSMRCLLSTCMLLSPSNGTRPVHISNRTTPHA